MSSLSIRPATAADAEAIAALHRGTHAEHVAMIEGYDARPWDDEIIARLIDPGAEARPFTVLVAALGGHFAGHLALHPIKALVEGQRLFHISDVSVRAGDRGYGVGRALVKAAEEEATREGATAIIAQIWPANTASQQFFAAMGYSSKPDSKRGLVVAGKALGEAPPLAQAPANLDRFALIGAMGLLAFIGTAILLGLLT
ncbi:GNAT family N-acetyltransferase [Vannielia litorea]|uniref:GNAT family N-acetyltransferase n=1 Tax=Vannielia litorea TaxID=1217970 RepID=UPI001BD0E255|nr:GNAT family N-acetyltransferase [Vannielia litorea]